MRWLVVLSALLTVGCGDVEFPMAPTLDVPGFYQPNPGPPVFIDRSNPPPCTGQAGCRPPGR